jgi:hypothetical protein
VPGADCCLRVTVARVKAFWGIGSPEDILCLANHAAFGGSLPVSGFLAWRSAQPLAARVITASSRTRERSDELPTSIEYNVPKTARPGRGFMNGKGPF